MQRERWTNIGIAAGIGTFGCIASVIGAATLLHSDDGLHVLAGLLYGVPAACVLAGIIAGAKAVSHRALDGLLAAELVLALACLALTAMVARPTVAVTLFVSSQLVLVPVWAVGACVGGMLTKVAQSFRQPS